MTASFPFHSDLPDTAEAGVYHTHPRCRIGQGIASASRVAGTGVGRRECPFCFMLGQFQANRALRGYSYLSALAGAVPGQGANMAGKGQEQPCP
ncbi:hypothetical protein [Hymenobacter antarcticus]|uniref:Uncharacterized protein n=1 Tax=Hymenobacter antarcticus TaxID=486270 RepID=A0ABP7Q2V8_9BACT